MKKNIRKYSRWVILLLAALLLTGVGLGLHTAHKLLEGHTSRAAHIAKGRARASRGSSCEGITREWALIKLPLSLTHLLLQLATHLTHTQCSDAYGDK